MMCVARSEHLNIEWIDCNIDHLGKGGYVVGNVGLSVCLSVDNITQKVMNGMKNWLNFGGDLGILRWVNGQKYIIIVVAYPDRGAGNDSKPLGLAFHHQGSTLLHWEIWE